MQTNYIDLSANATVPSFFAAIFFGAPFTENLTQTALTKVLALTIQSTDTWDAETPDDADGQTSKHSVTICQTTRDSDSAIKQHPTHHISHLAC